MLTVAFINPPHADWINPNMMTWLFMQSHYNAVGKYKDQIKWLPAPYKYNKYENILELYEEIKSADVILFSSYVWNYDLCDELATVIKDKHPEKITIIGGPHIGIEDDTFQERKLLYDYVCKPTKPGESFMEDFLNLWIEHGKPPSPEDISWELRSVFGKNHAFPQVSVYEEHIEYLTMLAQYADDNNLEKYVILETTRGCPYQCTYCEWGGGIGGKVIKKDLEIIKKDILALKQAGYTRISLNDANFGMFEDRDLEFFEFAIKNDMYIIDASTVKAKGLERRKRLIDRWFDIVGNNKNAVVLETRSGIPTVSIQSASEEAMKVAKRTDLSFEDKIKLSEYVNAKCQEYSIQPPPLEIIMGMPGVTLADFYREMEIIWNFKAWESYRHIYMFLPDASNSKTEYVEKYQIELVKVYANLLEEAGIDNKNSMYVKKQSYFNTIASCYSFTREEMCEMFFMNLAGNYLLKELYPTLQDLFTPSEFCSKSFQSLKTLDGFDEIYTEIQDLYNPLSSPGSTKLLQNRPNATVIENFIENNRLLLITLLFV